MYYTLYRGYRGNPRSIRKNWHKTGLTYLPIQCPPEQGVLCVVQRTLPATVKLHELPGAKGLSELQRLLEERNNDLLIKNILLRHDYLRRAI